MHEFMVYDDQGDEYSYTASDMWMALTVHYQIVGTEPFKAERI